MEHVFGLHRPAALLRNAVAALALFASLTAWALPDHVTVPATNPYTLQALTFSLDRYNLRATNYQVRVYSSTTSYTLIPTNQLPEVTTYRGRIPTDPGAMVVGSFDPSGNFVYLVTYGCREVNTDAMDPYDGASRLLWGGWGASVPTTYIPTLTNAYTYAYQTNMPSHLTWSTANYPVNTTNYGGPVNFNSFQKVPLQRVRLIQDLSTECFLNSCGSNLNYAIMMQESRVNEMDYLEARDFGICYQIVANCLRPTVDPFTSGGNNRLSDLRTYWSADPGWSGDNVQNPNSWFDMVQGTMNLGGGVAYCPGSYAVTDPGFNGNVEGHEVGHNWGALDVTSIWDYTGENRWHWEQTGSGYGYSTEMVNRAMGIRRYGETYKNAANMEWVKYNSPVAPWATPDFAITTTNQAVSLNVLLNDHCSNSNALSVVSFETNTPAGGLVANLGNGFLQYTPPPNFTGYDWFHYYVGEPSGLKSLSEAHVRVGDPGNPLLAQWSFDQTNGTTLAEATGRGVAGTLQGTAAFGTGGAAGINNSGALHLDGSGYVQFPGRWFDPLNGNWSLSLWCKPDVAPASDQVIFSKADRSGANGLFLAMGSGSIYLKGATFGIASSFSVSASLAPQPGVWYHVVAEIDRTNNLARLWVNGVEYTGTSNTRSVPATEFIFGEAPPALGACFNDGTRFAGALDEVRLYSKALTQAEITALYLGGGMLPAVLASPFNGELNVALQPLLAWTAGRTNYQHDVYLGTNYSAVINATTSSAEYKGRVTLANYQPPATLLAGATYYWRVDEVENATNFASSPVWSFVTAVDAIHGGLKLHLTLDARDTVGTNTYDRSGPPFKNGALYHNPSLAAGKVNEAMNFNGTNSYIGLGNPNDLNFAGRITIAAWVKPAATDSQRNILEHGYQLSPNQEVALRISGGYYQILSWDGNNHLAQYAIPGGDLNTWVHLVGEFDGTTWRLFRNGTQVATAADTVGSIQVNGTWSVGATGDNNVRFWQGGIDDVMMWNRALSTGEITFLYTNALAGLSIDGARPGSPPASGFTWLGGSDSFWTTAANWAANAVPGPTDTVFFSDAATGNLGTSLGASLSIAGLNLSGGMAGLGIGGSGTLTLGAGGLVMTNYYPFTVATLSAPVVLGASQVWSVGTNGTLNLSGGLNLGGMVLTLSNNSTTALSGAPTGSGGLVVRGSGATTFSAPNPSSGGTTVNGGNLEVLGGGTDGTYSLTNGGTLKLAYSTAGGYANTYLAIYGDGAAATSGFYLRGGYNYNGSGQIQLLNAPTTIRQYGTGLASIGIFDINATALWCSSAASGSASDANVQYVSDGYGMSMQVDAGANTAGGDFTINGPLNVDSLGLYKRGGGSLRLNTAALSGNTALQLQGGTVICGAANCIGASAALNMSGGTTLDLNGFSQTVASASLGGGLMMSINKGGSPASSVLTVPGSTLTYAGGLTVTSVGSALASGDSFTLFSASSYAGSFASTNLPALRPGLGWSLANLAVNGSLSVTGTPATFPPTFSPPPGNYVEPLAVILTSDPTATIFYTTNGSSPTSASAHGPVGSGAATIILPAPAAITIKAYATNSAMTDSAIASAAYRMVPLATNAWNTPVTIADDTDLALSGTPVFAYDWNNAAVTVNGVSFTAPGSGVTLSSGLNANYTGFLTGTAAPATGLSAGYQAILTGGEYAAGATACTVTLNNLTVGEQYLVQFWVNDSRNLSQTRTESIKSAGNLVTLSYPANSAGALGQYTIGTFIATAATKVITNTGNYSTQINALQLRDLGSGTVATPAFSLPGGSYLGAQTVAITGAGTIFFTTNGVNPTTASPVYTGPITVPADRTMTLKAFATSTGQNNSAIASATYATFSNPTWITAAGGSWTSALNWSNSIVGGGTDMAANFTAVTLNADATVTLDGARTNGNLLFDDRNSTQHAWTLAPGSGGILTLAVSNGAPVISNAVATTINAVVAGTQGLIKTGGGVLTLSSTNTYTGPTLVSNGMCLVNGSLGSGTVTVAGGTLGGIGVVNGATTVQSGGTLAPGASAIGRLTVSNSVSLSGGSLTVMELSRNGGVPTNDLAFVSGTLTQGGSLIVTNIGTNALLAGDSFKLFVAGTWSGAFTNLNLPPLTAGLRWSTNTLAANGTIAVSNVLCTLTYLAAANGALGGSPTQTVNYGASGSAVTLLPNPGYHFVNWSDGGTANPRTDSNVTSNLTVTANFAINTYTLAYASGSTNGTVSGATNQTVNYADTGTAVTPVADTGYHFVNWSDGSTANPRTDANVTNDLTVTANFAINTYTLTYTAGTNGTLTGTSPQTVNYGAGGSAVSAVANSGFTFTNWSDGLTLNPRTDLNVTNHLTVTAKFVAVHLAPPVITNATMALNRTNFTLTGTGAANQNYVLLTATNLPPVSWLPVQTNTADTNGVFQFTDPGATNRQQFYRIQSNP